MAMGRPTKMTPETIKKLEEAFLMGCTDPEACLYADISKATLYNYQNANPDFVDRKDTLKSNPVMLARKVQLDALKDDSNKPAQQITADKVLSRHEGIKQRLEHANADGKPFKTDNKYTVEFVDTSSNKILNAEVQDK